jgi:hypothetical protein
MHITFDVISGRDRGRSITLPDDLAGDLRPWVTELDPLKITVALDAPATAVKLLVGEVEVELSQLDDQGLVFCGMPLSRYEGGHGYSALFLNYFGIAPIYIDVTIDGVSALHDMGSLEVLARKASVEQAKEMVSYVLRSGHLDLLRAQGATRRSAGASRDEGQPPKRLLEHLDHTVRTLEKLVGPIALSPVKTLTSKLNLIHAPADLDIQEQGLSWLCENLGVLEPSDDINNYVLIHSGQMYKATEIQAPVTQESTDIYENQVIHGFLDSLLAFVHQLSEGMKSSVPAPSLNSAAGYESFFNVMSEWLEIESQVHLSRVHHLRDRVKRIQRLIRRSLPVTKLVTTPPSFTPKARANRHYSALYRMIHDWHRHTTIDWTVEKFLMAISSIPKLFELYSLLIIVDWLKTRSPSLSTNADAFASGHIEKLQVDILYEPVYWLTGHVNANEGNVVVTEFKKVERAVKEREHGPSRRTHPYDKRAPDFVIDIKSMKDGVAVREGLLVLDAKYVNKKRAYEEKIAECTMKYVHGLASPGLNSLVRSMIILYPEKDDLWLDFRAGPYDLFGNKAQRPALGAQGLPIDSEIRQPHLFKVLDKIVESYL